MKTLKSLTFPWQLSNSPTFPGFPDKWSPWIMVSFLQNADDRDDIWRRQRINILYNIVHVKYVTDKQVRVWQIWLSFGNDWLQLLQRRVDTLNNILINVLATVDVLQKFSVCVWYTRCRQRNEIVHFFICHAVQTES